jgi:hypothetical protein
MDRKGCAFDGVDGKALVLPIFRRIALVLPGFSGRLYSRKTVYLLV